MTINLTIPSKETELKATIMVIGVGGAGGNAINNMIRAELNGVNFIAMNTDNQALNQSEAGKKIHLGKNETQGLGGGTWLLLQPEWESEQEAVLLLSLQK